MKLGVMRYLVPVALLTLAVTGDILVQRFEAASEWDSLIVAFRAVRFGLFFGAGAFLFGRRIRWAFVSLWCLFCVVLAIECVARFNFGMVLGGDWVMILLASSGEEICEFSRQFSLPVVLSVALALPLALAAWRMLRRGRRSGIRFRPCRGYRPRRLAGGQGWRTSRRLSSWRGRRRSWWRRRVRANRSRRDGATWTQSPSR